MAQSNSTNRTRKSNTSTRSKSSGNTRSNSGNRKASTNRNSTKKPSNNTRNSNNSDLGLTFADYWYEFKKSRFFKPVLIVVIPVLLVLLDLLFAWNNFDRFFIILGVELLILAAAWVIGFVFNLSMNSTNPNPPQE